MSIKIGDKIRIKSTKELLKILGANADLYNSFAYRMWEFAGREMIVTALMDTGNIGSPGNVLAGTTEKNQYIWDLRFVDLVSTEPKFKVGDKVVPIAKSVGSHIGTAECLKNARIKNQPFLNVRRVHLGDEGQGDYTCDEGASRGGDWFLESDLTPYSRVPKFKVGDKVVPITKTVCNDLEHSNVWKAARQAGQSFLVISSVHLDYHVEGDYTCFFNTPDSGDFFNESDLAPYVEPVAIRPALNCAPKDRLVNSLTVQYVFTGSTTTCIIEQDGEIYVGSSNCMPGDVWVEKTGKDIAKAQAIIALDKGELDQLIRGTCSKLGGGK